jgi:hypothetical protein
MMTLLSVKVLLILILTGQLGFCLSKLAQEDAQESANGILTFRLLLETIYYQFIITASSI